MEQQWLYLYRLGILEIFFVSKQDSSINTALGLTTTQNKWSVVYNAVTGKYAFSTLLIPFSLLLDPGNSSANLANLLGFPPIDTTGI